MNWHVDATTARHYAARTTDVSTSASVEAHLSRCDECRTLVGGSIDDDLLAAVWYEVDAILDTPTVSVTERALRRMGCSSTDARIVGATTQARWSYAAAVALSVFIAAWTVRYGDEAVFSAFLLIAPFGPLVATAASFGRWADPVHAVVGTTPTSTWRILLVRTAASVVPAIVVTGVCSLLLRNHGWAAMAWLLPALALCVGALALSSWVDVERAVIAEGALWLTLPLLTRVGAVDIVAAMTNGVQWASLFVLIVAAAVIGVRHTTFDYWEAR